MKRALRFRGLDDDDDDADSGLEAFLGNLPSIIISVVVLVVVYSFWKMIQSPTGTKFIENMGELAGTAVDMLGDWRLFLIGYVVLGISGAIATVCTSEKVRPGACNLFGSPNSSGDIEMQKTADANSVRKMMGVSELVELKKATDMADLELMFRVKELGISASDLDALEEMTTKNTKDEIFKQLSAEGGHTAKKKAKFRQLIPYFLNVQTQNAKVETAIFAAKIRDGSTISSHELYNVFENYRKFPDTVTAVFEKYRIKGMTNHLSSSGGNTVETIRNLNLNEFGITNLKEAIQQFKNQPAEQDVPRRQPTVDKEKLKNMDLSVLRKIFPTRR